jgi:hypothetical protein
MIILLSDNYWAIIEWIGVSKTKKIDKLRERKTCFSIKKKQ